MGTPRRVGWVAAALVAGVSLAAWYLSRPAAPKRVKPAVFVNGAPKERVSEHGKAERWADVPVTVKVDASVQALGPEAVAAVQAGFGAWVALDARLPSLTFDTVRGLTPRLEPDGVSAVLVAPIDFPGHKYDLALTVSFVDPETGRILEADVVINARKKFGVLGGQQPPATGEDADPHDHEHNAKEVPGCAGVYDLQAVVTHEAGHFFGLDEDRDDPATTMYFKTGKCEIHKRDLEVSDRTAMVGLYDKPAPPAVEQGDTGGGCGGASLVPTRRFGAGWLLVAAAGTLGLWHRRCPGRRMRPWPRPS